MFFRWAAGGRGCIFRRTAGTGGFRRGGSRRFQLVRRPAGFLRRSAAVAAGRARRWRVPAATAGSCLPQAQPPGPRCGTRRVAALTGAAGPGRGRWTFRFRCPAHGGENTNQRGQFFRTGVAADYAQRRFGGSFLLAHSGMFPCFFGNDSLRLLRSARSARTTCVRVSCGRITRSM